MKPRSDIVLRGRPVPGVHHGLGAHWHRDQRQLVRAPAPRLGRRVVVMHGHHHIDWTGECGSLRIVSAPSPVMEATDAEPTSFYIHTLATAPEGRLCLLRPERVDVDGNDARPRAGVSPPF